MTPPVRAGQRAVRSGPRHAEAGSPVGGLPSESSKPQAGIVFVLPQAATGKIGQGNAGDQSPARVDQPPEHPDREPSGILGGDIIER